MVNGAGGAFRAGLVAAAVTRKSRHWAACSARAESRMYFSPSLRKGAVSHCAVHFPSSKMASAPKCFVVLKFSISRWRSTTKRTATV